MKNFPLPEYKSEKPEFVVLNGATDVDNFIKEVTESAENKLVAVDTETYYDRETGGVVKTIAGAKNNKPFCLTATIVVEGEYKSYFIDEDDILQLKPLLENEEVAKILHNAKFDMHMLKNIGISVNGDIWDTMIMIHLIDEEHMCNTPDGGEIMSKSLKNLAYHYLGDNGHMYEDLVDEARNVLAKNRECAKAMVSYRDVYEACPDIMKDYACSDTEFTYKLFNIFKGKLQEQELMKAYEVDLNATKAVFEMERNGVRVDLDYYSELDDELTEQIKGIDNEIREMGMPDNLNVNSAEDLVKMFGVTGMQWHWYTEKGAPSTGDATLRNIINNYEGNSVKLAELILKRRECSKLSGTFISQIMSFVQADGRLHPDFNVCPREEKNHTVGGTVTGRLSSSNPNFQNFPKDDKRIRKGMLPTEGFYFVELDYSQQEYRLLGAYANDRNFSDVIHAGKDIHTGTAELMLGLSEAEAKLKKNRDIGKKINFSLVYGLGAAQFAANLGFKIDTGLYNKASFMLRRWNYKPWEKYPSVDEIIAKHKVTDPIEIEALNYYFSDEPHTAIEESSKLKEQYFNQFPNINEFLKNCRERTKYRGYCKTWTGRRRHFKHPKEEAYKAPNAVIQGGCGDITKIKMWECLQLLNGYKSRMVNNIHDAILFEIAEDELWLIPKIKELMVDVPFKVPFDCSVEMSNKSWADMKEIDDLSELEEF